VPRSNAAPLEWILLDCVHGSFYKKLNQIRLKTHPASAPWAHSANGCLPDLPT